MKIDTSAPIDAQIPTSGTTLSEYSRGAGAEASARVEGMDARDTDPAPRRDSDGSDTIPGGPPDVSAVELVVPTVADPLIGVVVAERYRIVEPLGRGGMGIVYKVEHARIGKLMAMKLLTGELSRNPEVVRRFKQEALTVSKLSSPSTVQVFDFGATDGLTYLVMELVTGEDLARTLKKTGPMPFNRLAKIVAQICNSLAEAHQQGIVHRDVKPENIMLVAATDGRDIAKVLDFGLAKLREGSELNDVTTQGAIVGTPYFMAPEQIRGEPVDQRTDIYSLGALMYRALTGHYPFGGPTPMAVFTKHLTQAPTSPSLRAPECSIPPSISAVVLKALAKSPSDRFQRIEDLKSALLADLVTAGSVSGNQLYEAPTESVSDTRTHELAADIATRVEVERYERKLRRKRYSVLLALGLTVCGGTAAATAAMLQKGDIYGSVEVEPNNTAGEANAIQLGKPISGYLGRRIDPRTADRDVYVIDLAPNGPADASVISLTVSSLPNFAMCTMIYRQGLTTAIGQYCVGRAARDLTISALRLPAGRYFVAVSQDLDPYGGPTPPVYENVSDLYTLLMTSVPEPKDTEIEPNDQVASANILRPGEALTGAIGWARDEDVFCVSPDVHDPIQWRVRDVVRDAGAVLEGTPLRRTAMGAPVRIHAVKGKTSPTDVVSPWQSQPQWPDDQGPACLRLRLVADPWSVGATSIVPNGGRELYTVEVVPTT
jgi:serine/threonine-protein kinase